MTRNSITPEPRQEFECTNCLSLLIAYIPAQICCDGCSAIVMAEWVGGRLAVRVFDRLAA